MSKKKPTQETTEVPEPVIVSSVVRRYTIPSLGVSVEATDAKDAVVKANKKVKEK